MSLVTINLYISADMAEINEQLHHITERVNVMPTIDEVKAAVAEAVAAEREQVRLAIIKAVEDALANASTISEDDKNAIVAAIQSVYEPTA